MVDDVLSQIKDFVAAQQLAFEIFILISFSWSAFVSARFKYPESRSELNNSIKKWAPKVMLSSLPAIFTMSMILMLCSTSGYNLLTPIVLSVCGTIGMGVTFAFTALSASSTYYKGK